MMDAWKDVPYSMISTNDPALVWHWKVQFLLCLKIDDLLKKLVLSEAMRTHVLQVRTRDL